MELISDRKTSVQATICRVMKTRRELCHKDLCEEVKQQLEHLFIPDIAFIKKVCVYTVLLNLATHMHAQFA
jgi:Cullin protein neddylation domain